MLLELTKSFPKINIQTRGEWEQRYSVLSHCEFYIIGHMVKTQTKSHLFILDKQGIFR